MDDLVLLLEVVENHHNNHFEIVLGQLVEKQILQDVERHANMVVRKAVLAVQNGKLPKLKLILKDKG